MQAGEIIRNWVLVNRLGAGGIGEVWKAEHDITKQKRAIKAIYPHLNQNSDFYERFVQEAKAMAALKHQNIVEVLDFFSENDRAFLVMSYIKGQSLHDIIESRGPLPATEIRSIAIQILSALAHAHQQNVIHRDVKPSNIMIEKDGVAYLVDFGIALELGEKRLTKFGTNVGTPEYMSPEQIKGGAMDKRTDIYSFGCVLYEMLTGQPPFGSEDKDGKAEFEIMHSHINEKPTPPGKIADDIDRNIENAVLKALEKDPDDRFQDCKQMSQALSAVPSQIDGGRTPRVNRRTTPQERVIDRESLWSPLVYVQVLQKYAAFDGRARRHEYWYFLLVSIVICGALYFIGHTLNPYSRLPAVILPSVYFLPVVTPLVAVTVRRLHDIGRNAKWLLLFLVPVVGQIAMVFMLIQDGDLGENDYGPDPKQK